jgi:hypothetical protein
MSPLLDRFTNFFKKQPPAEMTDQERMMFYIEQTIEKSKLEDKEHCTICIFQTPRETPTGATLELFRPELIIPEDANYIEDRLIKMGHYCSTKYSRNSITVFVYFDEDQFKF